MNIIERLNEEHPDKLRYFLSKAGIAPTNPSPNPNPNPSPYPNPNPNPNPNPTPTPTPNQVMLSGLERGVTIDDQPGKPGLTTLLIGDLG